MNTPDNQLTQFPTCAVCGKQVRHNVPRLGAAAGFVHAHDGSHLCPKPDAPQEVPDRFFKDLNESMEFMGKMHAASDPASPAPSKETIARVGASEVNELFSGALTAETVGAIAAIILRALDRAGEAKGAEASKWKDCAEYAWTILANAGGGDWTKESADWQKAVINWRDNSYYPLLSAPRPPASVDAFAEARSELAALAKQVEHERNPKPDRPLRQDEALANKAASVDAGTPRTQAEYERLNNLALPMQERFEQMRVWAERLDGWLRGAEKNSVYLEAQLSYLAVQLEESKKETERCQGIVRRYNADIMADRIRADKAEAALAEKEKELVHLKELREGDNQLIRALAESCEIKITASDRLLGAQWEQFHDGVLGMHRRLAALEEDKRRLDWLEKHWHDWQKWIGTDSDGWIKRLHDNAWLESNVRAAIDSGLSSENPRTLREGEEK